MSTLDLFVLFCKDMQIAEEGMFSKYKEFQQKRHEEILEANLKAEKINNKYHGRKVTWWGKFRKPSEKIKIIDSVEKDIDTFIKNEKKIISDILRKHNIDDFSKFNEFLIYENEDNSKPYCIDASYNDNFSVIDIRNGNYKEFKFLS